MNSRLRLLFLSCWALLGLGASQGRAQWLTQTIPLKAGWNAVFLHVDPSHATVDQLVGASAPQLTPIEQIWRWTPNNATAQFVVSPQQPVSSGSQWVSWSRADSANSALTILSGNFAYLVFSTTDYTWNLTGHPVLPRYQWASSGLNFFGFPTVTNSPPTFEDFLQPAPSLLAGEIYKYSGGPFGPTNPGRVFELRRTPVERGAAYWLRSGDSYNRFFGPFEVTAVGGGQVSFGDSLNSFSFRLKNLTDSPITITLKLLPSEAPPTGQSAIAGIPPLLLRGAQSSVDLTYAVSDLPENGTQTWTLTPMGQVGSEVEVALGLDRSAITANVGDLLAGVLRFTDSLGQLSVDLGVSATVASKAGLWVGAAAVNEVAQYLLNYLRDSKNNLVIQTNGAYVITDVVTNLTPVPKAYPLRLIVHSPDSGAATLWQRIYHGYNIATNAVISNGETVLAENLLGQARRISSSHLPWTDENPGWLFSGPLAQGAVLTTFVTNAFNARESNPFLHTYHPDHDNLDAQFRHELAQGSESYTVVRQITLSVKPPGTDFNSRIASGQTLGGEYVETIRVLGLARAGNTVDTRRFDVRGAFKLSRISNIATITRTP